MPRTGVIDFEDRPETVTVRWEPLTLDEFFAVREALDELTWAERSTFTVLYDRLAPFLVEWDFEQPLTTEGLMSLPEPRLGIAIAVAWVRGVREAPLPLPRRGSGPTPSPE